MEMYTFNPDMVTINRAANHLNISVPEALDLAERYHGIQRTMRREITLYSLTGFMKMHLQEAFEQQCILPEPGLPKVMTVPDKDTERKDVRYESSGMRWMDDGG